MWGDRGRAGRGEIEVGQMWGDRGRAGRGEITLLLLCSLSSQQ